MRSALPIIAAGTLLLSACRGQPSADPPVLLLRNMFDQQRYNPESASAFFTDHRTMRTPPAGTVAKEGFLDDDEIALGVRGPGTDYVPTIPQRVTEQAGGGEKLLARGQERYGIYCAPCHGLTGDGRGVVVVRAEKTGGYTYPAPPSYHQERLRHAPDGQIYAIIRNGIRNMPSYAAQVPVQDRWAIVAYVRALQLSQMGANTASAGATP